MVLVSSPRPSYLLAAALAVTGLAFLGIAVSNQRQAPTVPLSAPFSAEPAAPATAVDVATPRPTAGQQPLPTRITIPALNVRSTLLTLGLAADGSIATPPAGPHYDEAGWYRYSPRPGAVGPAVIVGHIDSKAGGPSVFFRLGDLRLHDRIEVLRADGSTAVFAVDAVRRFRKADFPTQLVYGNTDHPALRLITCGGPFDRTTGHYLDNIVVTASHIGDA